MCRGSSSRPGPRPSCGSRRHCPGIGASPQAPWWGEARECLSAEFCSSSGSRPVSFSGATGCGCSTRCGPSLRSCSPRASTAHPTPKRGASNHDPPRSYPGIQDTSGCSLRAAVIGRRSLAFQVDTMPGREAEQRPQDAFAVVAAREMVIEEPANHYMIEVAKSLQASVCELVLDHAPELVAKPLGGRTHEPPLRRAEQLLGQAALEGPLQESLVPPYSDLYEVWECEHPFYELLV